MTRFLLAALLTAVAGLAHAQGPARHDIVHQCPQLAEQLPERLAAAKRRVDEDGTVRVQLLLDASGALQIESLDGPRPYLGPVRRALQGLDCRSATPQRQVLNIRFEDPHAPGATRVAAAVQPSASATPQP